MNPEGRSLKFGVSVLSYAVGLPGGDEVLQLRAIENFLFEDIKENKYYYEQRWKNNYPVWWGAG